MITDINLKWCYFLDRKMLALVEGLLRTTEWRNQKRERVCVVGGFIGDVLMDNFK